MNNLLSEVNPEPDQLDKYSLMRLYVLAIVLAGAAAYGMASLFSWQMTTLLTPVKKEHFNFELVCDSRTVLKKNSTSGYRDSKSGQYVIGSSVYTPQPGSLCILKRAAVGFSST